MKPAILLIGSDGQVGREVSRRLSNIGDVMALGRKDLDLSKPADICRLIRSSSPNIIVNAAAYTAVDKAESDVDMARAVNAEAPAVMAEEAKRINASIIHYSTDYVFDGRATFPYDEDDPKNPPNIYGQTKLEGEQAIHQSGVAHLILRTGWVYAAQGRNFFLTILRLATQKEELKVVQDQIGAPTLASEIAWATNKILFQLCEGKEHSFSLSSIRGTYHLTAAGETSWCGFAEAILKEVAESGTKASWIADATNHLPIIARHVNPIFTREYPTPATRPLYSVLCNDRLAKAFGLRLPHWKVQLNQLFVNRG